MDDIEQYAHYSPFMAVLADRDEAAKMDIYKRFSSLPEEASDIVISEETAEQVKSWERAGIFPATHTKAVAKLIGLAILGLVRPEQIPVLLQKLNLDPTTITQTMAQISSILTPALSSISAASRPNMTSLPPMTRPTETGPKPEIAPAARPVASSQQASRNIIDLRKQ